MSFPYVLDLAFGSEKATVDPQGRLSFGKGGGSTGLPTTLDELMQAQDDGLAYLVGFDPDNWGTLNLNDEAKIPSTVVETLPENLKGVVILDQEDESVTSHTFTVTTDPLVITVNSVPEDIINAFIILKQAVD